jgi:hypothetical protein
MSGHWPPEWDSPAEDFAAEDPDTENTHTENLDPEFEAQLAEVAAFLAAVPGPVLPPGVEARISAAIAAEAQSPSTRSEVADLSAFAQRSRWRRLRSAKVIVPATAACLVLAIGGYFASLTSSSSGPMSSASSAAGTSGQAPAAVASAAGNGAFSAGGIARQPAASSASAAAAAPFVVTMSGTNYRAATLAAQARAQLAGYAADQPGRAPAASPRSLSTSGDASAAAPATAAGYSLPSGELLGCVEHFTGGSQPRLVDQGTYRGTPVYVIVGASKVWVVGLGCTASRPELLASAALAGDAGISAP